MIAIHRYYEGHSEWGVPRNRSDAMDIIEGAKIEGCLAILVYSSGRIIYQAIRRDQLSRMTIRFALQDVKLI